MELDHVSRRDVIKGIAGGLGGSVFATAVPELAFAQAVKIRRNLATAPTALITSLRNGVAAMQARPVSDPRSWQYWANAHGTPAAPCCMDMLTH